VSLLLFVSAMAACLPFLYSYGICRAILASCNWGRPFLTFFFFSFSRPMWSSPATSFFTTGKFLFRANSASGPFQPPCNPLFSLSFVRLEHNRGFFLHDRHRRSFSLFFSEVSSVRQVLCRAWVLPCPPSLGGQRLLFFFPAWKGRYSFSFFF